MKVAEIYRIRMLLKRPPWAFAYFSNINMVGQSKCLALASNPVYHPRSKHIDVDYYLFVLTNASLCMKPSSPAQSARFAREWVGNPSDPSAGVG